MGFNFYWLYDLPTWQLYVLVIGSLVAVSLLGTLLLRKRFDKWMGINSESNDIVGYFLSFTGAFYGIMLGLVAVGAWEAYNDAEASAEKEAALVASLYRDVTFLPSPYDGNAQAYLKAYAWDVVNLEWPEQRQGNKPYSARSSMDRLAAEINMVEPRSTGDEISAAEAARALNALLEARRYRVEASDQQLPVSLWVVIIVGALLNIIMTWMLSIKNEVMDLTINLIMSTLLGTVLAFVISVDNPFKGEISVSPDSMSRVYSEVMNGGAERPLL